MQGLAPWPRHGPLWKNKIQSQNRDGESLIEQICSDMHLKDGSSSDLEEESLADPFIASLYITYL